MFESVDTSKELSARLRQDMNPPVPGVIEPSAPSKPPPSAEDIFDKSADKVVPIKNESPIEDIITPEVETTPFISQVSDWRKKYLAWIAIIMILPSSFFWLASLLYTTGAKTILLKIVTAIPFLVIVILNIALPVLTIISALIMLLQSEPGDRGRLTAKLALGTSIICLLALGWWLLAEIL